VFYEQNFDAHEEYPPYWAQLWPSSVALARAVAIAKPAGARVLELRCGLGLPSIAAALSGAHVLATDRSTDALGFTTYWAAPHFPDHLLCVYLRCELPAQVLVADFVWRPVAEG
jgi:hypothetical protein